MAQKKITDLQLIDAITEDLSLPGDDGIQTYRMTPLQLYNYIKTKLPNSSDQISNLTLTTSVASSALTIAVKNYAGNNASSGDPIRVSFRSATLTTGAFLTRELNSALSLVISSGSTLGQTSGVQGRIWVYLIDNAGTMELAVSRKKFSEDKLVSTTAEGGAGAADSASVMYSTSARTNVPCRIIGYILNTQTTAGAWASAGSEIQLAPFEKRTIKLRAGMTTTVTVAASAICKLDTVVDDLEGMYSTSTGLVTFPESRSYAIAFTMQAQGGTASSYAKHNGTAIGYFCTSGGLVASGSLTLDAKENDTLGVYFDGLVNATGSGPNFATALHIWTID